MFLTTVLRLTHILTAFIWVGMAFSLVLLVIPASSANAETGHRFSKALYTRTPISALFPIAVGVTTVVGLLLYATGSHQHFSSLGNAALGTGALFGILAAGHGIGANRAVTGRYVKALNQHVQDGKMIAADAMDELNALSRRVGSNGRVSLALSVIALVGMGVARYL